MEKRGRPAKDEGRRNSVTVRLTDEDLELLDYVSFKTGKSRSDIIRESLKMRANLAKYQDN